MMQPETPFRCVLDARASLGECPTWSHGEQVLYWVDINAPALHRFDPATGANAAMAMPSSIGSFGLRAGGGFIVALRDGIWLARADGSLERKVHDAPYDPQHHRFNDGRVDPQGRFWAGSMNENRDAASGALFRIDSDLSMTRVLSGITISNGLAWSPDGRTMYHADTPTMAISAYAFDPVNGMPGAQRRFHQFHVDGERPDGAAVDEEGNYWSALYRGGCVVELSPGGEVLARYPTPAMCPTMCAFGGPDLRTLFVTTARHGRSEEELARLPQSGSLFAMQVETPGRIEPLFAS